MLRVLSGKMRCDGGRINHFLQLVLAGMLLAMGCASTPDEKQLKKDKKDVAQLRVYREAADFQGRAAELGSLGVSKATIGRSEPFVMGVLKDAVLDERDVKSARVLDQPDGSFSIGIEFTTHGGLVLQMNSLAVQGQHLAVAARWSDGTNVIGRFIAAPLIRRQLDKGAMVFTPDMSRDEANRFVRGLNNVAIKLENQAKPAREKKAKADKKAAEKKAEKPSSAFKRDFDPFLPQPQ